MANPKYSRLQAKGQITLPADIRRKLGLQKGDLVAFEECSMGIVISPRKVVRTDDVEEMNRLLEEHGMTFQDLIDQIRDERLDLVKELHGIDLSSQHE